MKKFVFKLERVLKYRKTIQDEKKRVLILKNQQLYSAQERLRNLQEEASNNGIKEGVVNINYLILTGQYEGYLFLEIEKQKDVIEKIKKEVQEAKDEYLEATKEAKTLEVLKEKQETEYKKNRLKEEEKEIDSTVTQRFNK